MESVNSELIVTWYKDIEKRLAEFIKFVPYSENSDIVLPLLVGVIIEAGSLIDSVMREELVDPSKNRKDLTIVDFAEYYETKYELGNRKALFFTHPLIYMQPFNGWFDDGIYTPLEWWGNYNKLKHDRIREHHRATLATAIYAVSALHLVISIFPTFFDALLRNDMLFPGHYNVEYVRENILQDNPVVTILIESELFASVRGSRDFPEDPNEISPALLVKGKMFWRYVGKEI